MNKKTASLRGPVAGLKGPIPGLKGTIVGPIEPIPGLKGPLPGLRRPISGLKRTIPGLIFYLSPDWPISGLIRSFASLRRSNLGLRSNLVHSSLMLVYPRHERTDFTSEYWSLPPLSMRKASHARGIKLMQESYSSGTAHIPSLRDCQS